MSINDRIEQIIEYYKLNKNSFSKKLKLSNNVSIGNIVGGRKSKPSYDLLQSIITHFPQLSPSWLLTGKGAMLLDSDDAKVNEPETAYKKPATLDDFSIEELVTYIHKNESARNFDKNETYKMFLEICFQRKMVENMKMAKSDGKIKDTNNQ